MAPMNQGGRTLIMNHWLLFPLTPALSRGERENHRQTSGKTTIPVIGWPTVHVQRRARPRAQQLPAA